MLQERNRTTMKAPKLSSSITILGMVKSTSMLACAFTGIGSNCGHLPTTTTTKRNTRNRHIKISSSPPANVASSTSFTAPWTTMITTTTSLPMSSIGQDETKQEKKAKRQEFNIWKYLPSPPEDQLTLSGDVAALFVYAFLDHTLNDFYGEVVRNGGDGGPVAAIDPILAAEVSASQQIPVWYDTTVDFAGAQGAIIPPPMEYAHYAPAINTAGTAAIVLTFIWLFSGYITGAFLYRNTVECNPSRAMLVTGKTWVLATIITVGIALASDALGDVYDIVHYPSLGGLTKADADFIFGDLSVLAMWRFMISFLLGSGDGDGDE
uniref:Uncharacterized protein n=3 Tax=Ditylum brightwellii TaxID=49249 RepID=A0A6U3TWK3_9STRA|mmetsp:Transcript_5995/g.7794  ORF Transcript_5995/g.7794 Transcript_5995/m.7794 type:complete len:322 (+) Transcript_5995:233-1198(+)